jgi:Protein of unknown function (DUF4239)
MILWVESQPTLIIALMVFGFCYLLAAGIFFGAKDLFPPHIGARLKMTAPPMLSAIGVITGLVIAFTASQVWTNLASAEDFVAREASAVRDIVLLADSLPDDLRTQVRSAVTTYVQFVQAEDWPAMVKGSANLRQSPTGLREALRIVLAANFTHSGQLAAQQRFVVAITQALEARRHRILLSEAAIDPIQWIIILILDVLMLITILLVHADRVAALANMLVFSSAVAACVLLLMATDRPFSYGGITLEPTALREVAPD